jgi:hypothetical protein
MAPGVAEAFGAAEASTACAFGVRAVVVAGAGSCARAAVAASRRSIGSMAAGLRVVFNACLLFKGCRA